MENEWITWLRQRLPPSDAVDIAIGDDASVLADGCSDSVSERTVNDRTVVTTDLLIDQVHFRLEEHSPGEIGRKSLAVNLSDLAAMAAVPRAAFVSIAVPRDRDLDFVKRIYEGLLPLAEDYNVAIAGGDTNRHDGPLVISLTLLGRTTERGPLLRSGAKPGDQLLVTGLFGGSILGKHLRCEPRVREALLLHEQYELHAGLDCSDGLALDTSRICQESGCGAIIDLAALPVSEDAVRLAERSSDGITAIEHALGDGEDFELILAVPAEEATRLLAEQPLATPVTRIGEFVAERGLWQITEQGNRETLPESGYEHR